MYGKIGNYVNHIVKNLQIPSLYSFYILSHFETQIGAINPIHYRSATQIQLLMMEIFQIIQYSEAVDLSVV